MIGAISEAIRRMTNLEDFRIVTWGLPSSCNLKPLWHAAWSTFGPKLKRVAICANLAGHQDLINSNPCLSSVQRFELEFSDDLRSKAPRDRTAEDAFLKDDLVPFVNRLGPYIKTFKIRSWSKMDLSPFFRFLDPLPQLEEILVRIPFNQSLLDPPAFTDFIIASSATLKDVALRLTPTGLALDPTQEQPVLDWMQSTLSDTRCFANVVELDLCPTNLPGGVGILQLAIERTPHLKVFKLRDRYLTPEDTILVVKALSTREELISLRLNVYTLTVQVIDAMAKSLPQLKYLWLSLGDRRPNTDNSDSDFLVSCAHPSDRWVLANCVPIGCLVSRYPDAYIQGLETVGYLYLAGRV